MVVRSRKRYTEKKVDKKPVLTLTHLDKTESQHPVSVITADEITTPIHQLIVCTKAGDTLTAMNSIRPSLAEHCNVLLLQNGMGSQETVTEAFPAQNIWIGSTTDGAWISKPLHVHHAGQGLTEIGCFNHQPATAFLRQFQGFHLKMSASKDIGNVLWQKLAVNCAINGLTALFDCQNGALLEHDKKPLMDELINEFTHISKALGRTTPEPLHEKVYKVCRLTADNHSSTCMDVRLQRKTELAFMNGYLIRIAEKEGLKLPAHQKLMDKLSQKGVRW